MGPQLPQPISRIFVRGCSEAVRAEILSTLPIHEGDTLSDESLRNAVDAVKAFDGRLEIFVNQDMSRDDFFRIPAEIRKGLTPPPVEPRVNVTVHDPASVPRRIRIESSVLESWLISTITPVDTLSGGSDDRGIGVVRVCAVVGKDGAVIDATAVAGPEMLNQRAVDALKQ